MVAITKSLPHSCSGRPVAPCCQIHQPSLTLKAWCLRASL